MYGYILTEFLINGEDRLRTLCLVIRLNSFERQFFKKRLSIEISNRFKSLPSHHIIEPFVLTKISFS